jgi:hypothetical protein
MIVASQLSSPTNIRLYGNIFDNSRPFRFCLIFFEQGYGIPHLRPMLDSTQRAARRLASPTSIRIMLIFFTIPEHFNESDICEPTQFETYRILSSIMHTQL